jgi:hypothetical protein
LCFASIPREHPGAIWTRRRMAKRRVSST